MKMLRLSPFAVSVVLVLLIPSTPVVSAQDFPAAEFFVGFTTNNNQYGIDRHNSPGWHMSFGYNFIRNLRLVGDFAGQYHSTDIVWTNGRGASANDYQILFGPEFAIRSGSKATPFVHTLVGFATRHYAVPNGVWTCTYYSCSENHFDISQEWGFAAGVGGGLDLKIHDIVAVRLFQADWIPAHLSQDNPNAIPAQGQVPTMRGWQHNYRFSCGFNFLFGKRNTE